MKLSSDQMRKLNDLKLLCFKRGHEASWKPTFLHGRGYVAFTIDTSTRFIKIDPSLVIGVEDFIQNGKHIPLETESEAIERLIKEYDD